MDKTQAIEWYTRAATKGHVGAMRALGAWHCGGDKDVKKDVGVALLWLEKAAECGDARARCACLFCFSFSLNNILRLVQLVSLALKLKQFEVRP
jgi:TPR repeat protein